MGHLELFHSFVTLTTVVPFHCRRLGRPFFVYTLCVPSCKLLHSKSKFGLCLCIRSHMDMTMSAQARLDYKHNLSQTPLFLVHTSQCDYSCIIRVGS